MDKRLTNVDVLWLPANCTSLIQPLDQGIIHSFKSKYRHNLLQFIISHLQDHHVCSVVVAFALRCMMQCACFLCIFRKCLASHLLNVLVLYPMHGWRSLVKLFATAGVTRKLCPPHIWKNYNNLIQGTTWMNCQNWKKTQMWLISSKIFAILMHFLPADRQETHVNVSCTASEYVNVDNSEVSSRFYSSILWISFVSLFLSCVLANG